MTKLQIHTGDYQERGIKSRLLGRISTNPALYWAIFKQKVGFKLFSERKGSFNMRLLQRIALALVIIGALNWGLIGLFQYDLVAAIFGGQTAGLSRVIYTLVGISGLFALTLYFNSIVDDDEVGERHRINASNINYGTEFGEDDPKGE